MVKRILSCAIFALLVSTTVFAQEAPQPVRDKFLKETTHSSPQPAKTPDDFFKPFSKGFYISTTICMVGAIADVATSSGQELNPILRNRRGELNTGLALLLKGGTCAWPMLVERRHPRAAFWLRTITGAVWSTIAIRNAGQR